MYLPRFHLRDAGSRTESARVRVQNHGQNTRQNPHMLRSDAAQIHHIVWVVSVRTSLLRDCHALRVSVAHFYEAVFRQ